MSTCKRNVKDLFFFIFGYMAISVTRGKNESKEFEAARAAEEELEYPDYIKWSSVLMELQHPTVTPCSGDLQVLKIYVLIVH